MKTSRRRRLTLTVQILAAILLLTAMTLSLRSSVVEEEVACTASHGRLAIASFAGAVHISWLHRYAGTAQPMKPVPFATVMPLPEQFVGGEIGFGPTGWSYSTNLTLPAAGDPLFFHRFTRPFTYHPLPTTPAPFQVYFVPYSPPVPITFMTGTTIDIPCWPFILLSLIPLFRPIVRLGARLFPWLNRVGPLGRGHPCNA